MRVNELWYHFVGQMAPPAVASPDSGQWRSKITKTGGTPTCLGDLNGMTLTLDATDEVQNVCLYMGDILTFPAADIKNVDIWALVNGAWASAVSAGFGLIAARNDTLGSLAAEIGFRLAGAAVPALPAVSCRTYDGANDSTVISAACQAQTKILRFSIDLATGIAIRVPPPSLGGLGNALFSVANVQQNLRPVARTTQFNASKLTGNLQLYAQLQKTAAAVTASLSIQRIRIKYRSI